MLIQLTSVENYCHLRTIKYLKKKTIKTYFRPDLPRVYLYHINLHISNK